jgi:hypothetical protein
MRQGVASKELAGGGRRCRSESTAGRVYDGVQKTNRDQSNGRKSWAKKQVRSVTMKRMQNLVGAK